MKQVGQDSFEITNKKTGEKKVVAGAELSKYGLKKPFKAQDLAPAIGGTIGAITGSIAGPVGMGAGAAVGTAGGSMIKSLLTPRYENELTGNTKMGLPELSEQGQKANVEELKTIGKESAISGATSYAGAKILPIIGKGVSKAISTVSNKQNVIDAIVKVSKGGGKVTDKISLTNKIANDINVAAKTNKTPVDYGKVLNRIVERANSELSGNVREAVIKNAAKETPGTIDLVKAIAKKRGAGYLPNAKAATSKFNELLRQELKNEIHTVAPEIAKMDEAYSVIMSSGKSLSSIFKKLGIPALGIYAGSKIFGQK